MDLVIKNMVCARCIKTVTGIFKDAGGDIDAVILGVVKLKRSLSKKQGDIIKDKLLAEGFEILDDKRSKLVQSIKQLIIELVHHKGLDEIKGNLSDHISKKLNRDYNYLSNLFSQVEGITIEQYFILQKTEKVKEWLVYDELTLSEISYSLDYSSVAHLSAQFKKVTRLTPRQFKKLKGHHRKHLDHVKS